MNQEQNNLVYLYNQLLSSLNESELRDLSFKLNVPYEDLPGTTRKDKARELIKYLDRRGRIGELPEIVQDVSVERFPIRKVQMRWVSPFIVAAITLLFISALWMWYEPGFEPLIAVIGGMSGLTVAIFYEKSDKKLPNQIELFISSLIVVVAIIGLVRLTTDKTNHSPVIHALSLSDQVIVPNEKINVTVSATDPDGDPLIFFWSSIYGSVPGGSQPQEIIYTAPSSPGGGMDTISVTVIDPEGHKAKDQVNISIRASD